MCSEGSLFSDLPLPLRSVSLSLLTLRFTFVRSENVCDIFHRIFLCFTFQSVEPQICVARRRQRSGEVRSRIGRFHLFYGNDFEFDENKVLSFHSRTFSFTFFTSAVPEEMHSRSLWMICIVSWTAFSCFHKKNEKDSSLFATKTQKSSFCECKVRILNTDLDDSAFFGKLTFIMFRKNPINFGFSLFVERNKKLKNRCRECKISKKSAFIWKFSKRNVL